jgi:ABC-2 type transport system ATP-binding protein
MRRALDLARGVLHRPSVVFLDEPTLGLDPAQRRRIWGFLRRLCDDAGMTLFLTTHYLEEADSCDRVAIVESGEIIAMDTPEALKRGLGEETIELEGDDPADIARRVVAATGVEPLVTATGVTIPGPVAAATLVAVASLVGGGVRLQVGRPSLEDVFVSLTEARREARQ